MASRIALIMGLGNPGPKYQPTRHNAGFWFVDELAASEAATLRTEAKFQGHVCKLSFSGQPLWLLKPRTYMNLSGQSLSAMVRFYKIAPENILVIHDELDLPVGTIRLKQGGGHGGHNGLRDIIGHLGTKEFSRLRIGIGHPGNASDVTNYVLGIPSQADKNHIEEAIGDALTVVPDIIAGEFEKAMNELHRG